MPWSSSLGGWHDYNTKWPAYSCAWSATPEAHFRLAVGSCIEEKRKFIEILELNRGKMECVADAEHIRAPIPSKEVAVEAGEWL